MVCEHCGSGRLYWIRTSSNTLPSAFCLDCGAVTTYTIATAGGANPAPARDATSSCPDDRHDWHDVYYGHRCRRCETFVPFGAEPWMPDEPYQEEDHGEK